MHGVLSFQQNVAHYFSNCLIYITYYFGTPNKLTQDLPLVRVYISMIYILFKFIILIQVFLIN